MRPSLLMSGLLSFYDYLLTGDSTTLSALFPGVPHIDTQLRGEIKGQAAFETFVSNESKWLSERKARAEVFNSIESAERVVVEFVLYLNVGGDEIDLPVALAADREGQGVAAIRIYHSTWPLTGSHRVRPPLLPVPEMPLDEPEVVRAYMKGIAEADKETVLSLFTEDGYAREPSGARYKYEGKEGLKKFYGPALDSGGVILHHCTATFDEVNFAVEFICDEWANIKIPAQAGIAVYEIEGDLLKAARIYDDVSPPFLE